MKSQIKKECLKRINYLAGHLGGVKKMIKEEKYCIDIINQNLGVISALHKVNEKLLLGHLESCVSEAIKGNKSSRKRKIFEELLNVYKRLHKSR